ncbi:poly-gamma-glutamate hydrolase family protein [Nonomuraea purpurea]|uniref:Poly-gamma-glutamate hydrolase family protein n=1 Tax=Nonomuraea purpurea TaxID=1849276 RepID=A0ABV8GQZ7_9ACTN
MPAAITRMLTLALTLSVPKIPTPVSTSGRAADTYTSYADLAAHENENTDYRRVMRLPDGAIASHIAIHGGGIEPGTSQLADQAAAAGQHAFYAFEGLKRSANRVLHLTSNHFDEPWALALQARMSATVSWHGAHGEQPTTYVGGRDRDLADRVTAQLTAAGFPVAATMPPRYTGTSPHNIANRNVRGRGVQLEITKGQRRLFFEDGKLHQPWIDNPSHRTAAFHAYIAAVNDALAGL